VRTRVGVRFHGLVLMGGYRADMGWVYGLGFTCVRVQRVRVQRVRVHRV
jgi:hypothetical protein